MQVWRLLGVGQSAGGLEIEVLPGVVIADVADDLADPFQVVRDLDVGDLVAEEVAEDAGEVLVPGKGQETAGVGEHTDETAEHAHVGEGIYLGDHAVFLIEEPPAGAILYLPGDGAVVEVAD